MIKSRSQYITLNYIVTLKLFHTSFILEALFTLLSEFHAFVMNMNFFHKVDYSWIQIFTAYERTRLFQLVTLLDHVLSETFLNIAIPLTEPLSFYWLIQQSQNCYHYKRATRSKLPLAPHPQHTPLSQHIWIFPPDFCLL